MRTTRISHAFEAGIDSLERHTASVILVPSAIVSATKKVQTLIEPRF